MNKKSFHFSKALSSTFKLICKHPVQMLLPALVVIALTLPYQYFNLKFGSPNTTISPDYSITGSLTIFARLYTEMILQYFLIFLLAYIQFIVFCGYVRIISKWVDSNVEPSLKDYLILDFELFGKYLGVGFIYMILMGFGFLFFVIPGFVMMTLYNLCFVVLIDRKSGFRSALGISDKLVSGVMWEFFGFLLLSGLFLSGPNFYLAFNYSYFKHIELFVPILIITVITTLLSPLIQLTHIFLYKDLSAQQDEIDALKKEQIQA